ncbi:hypothetical protein Palpr_2044 [Paludibacter propionicigenes WB4]|uniref:Uncharacterized protein n=1 Tax=Paludibacter propionicigenes (strain DSM 17365 / JCM 13257 / WB4) TaxID=694427 RepID=E4T637_PALPW|nr:hypothetical protein [Paludibacter propionicigenes]ADQ80181.1 hypothetical protein Palpr_2044 [Paludibacter propionicigenes WB4]
MHYIIILIIIVGIVIWQITRFVDTKKKLQTLKSVFPEGNNFYSLTTYTTGEFRIDSKHDNPVWKIIQSSINNYLLNNKGAVSDFHLLKDIVDRNCDSKEEEIETQIPVPLYLGLVGTMAGILVGVGILWISGGLSDLLSSSTGNGAKGIEALLGGVAMAMISSINGILLTTWGAGMARKSKVELENNKHSFLGWIQVNLLPKLSDGGVAAEMEKVSQNLNLFNNTFSKNTHELKETFAFVQSTYKDISSVLNAINHLRINDIAKYNIQVYEKMHSYIDEVGALGMHLREVNQYLSATSTVVQKLDMVFEREISQFDERIRAIKRAVGNIDEGIDRSLTALNTNTALHLDEFVKSSVHLNERFERVIEEQHNTLENAVTEQQKQFGEELLKQEANIIDFIEKQNKVLESKPIDILVSELQNLTAVKTSIGNLERATKEQNGKLDRLSQSIEKLSQMKVNHGGIDPIPTTPKWMKIAGFAIGGCIALSGLFFVVMAILFLTKTLN